MRYHGGKVGSRTKHRTSPRRVGRYVWALLFLMLLVWACYSFIGLGSGDATGGPPDTMVAVSPSYVVESINAGVWGIYDKTGHFIQKVGAPFGQCASSNDARLRFDKLSGRWFAATFENTPQVGDTAWCLSVSTGPAPTPTSTYYQYRIPTKVPPSVDCDSDFVNIGFTTDKILLGGGRCFVVISKAAALAYQTPLPIQYFATGTAHISQHPFAAYSLSVNQPDAFVVSFDFNVSILTQVRVWRVRGIPGQGAGATAQNIDVALPTSLSDPPDAVQKGTTFQLPLTGQYQAGKRILDAAFRDGVLWTASHAGCFPPGDSKRSCATILRIDNLEREPYQPRVSGLYQFAVAGKYTYYPAVTVDSSQNLISVFNLSSSNDYISMYGAGVHAVSGSPTSPISIVAGGYPFNAIRYGDISGAAIDPSDEITAWVGAELPAGGPGSADWTTFVTQVSKAICGSPCAGQ